MDYLWLFILLSLVAEILGTISGFGSSLFFVPIAGFFLDFYSVLGITALFHLSSNITKIAFFRKGFDLKLVLTIGIPAVICVISGAYFSSYFNKRWLEIGLGIFLIVISAILLIFRNFSFKANTFNSLIGGAVSGFTAGLLGTGGAIRGLTLAAFNLEKSVFIATSAIIDLAIDFSRSVVYYSKGYMHKHDIFLVVILFGISILGTWLGQKALHYISEERFKKIVLGLIFCVGIITLYSQLT